jgi:acyl-coenzyme A thioesterase PaaI-like protein
MTDPSDSLPAFGTPGLCLKCGRPIDLEETMCEVCNRAGMTSPAATQMHGTVAVAVIGSVAGMAIVAGMLVGGVGPFAASIRQVSPVAEAAVVVEVEVANDGSRAGRARCELTVLDDGGSPVARTVALSPEVPAGGSIPFEAQIAGVTNEPAGVTVRCQ